MEEKIINRLRTEAERKMEVVVVATSAAESAIIDAGDANGILIGILNLTGGSTVAAKIVAYTDAAATLNATDIVEIDVDPDAAGDTAWLETSDAQIKQAGVNADLADVNANGESLRYLKVEIVGTDDDEIAIYSELGRNHNPRKDLTADVIA